MCAGAWLAACTESLYDGNISGLFYTGSRTALPTELGHTFRVNDPAGYDGQFYHLIAHDPLLRRGFAKYVDNPPLRWRRIGVPGLAALLTGGSDTWTDSVYILIELAFVFFGALWLGRLGGGVWGLGFLAIPAVLVSLDRMTIDLPLTALCIGLVWYAELEPPWGVYMILGAAALVRETGIVLIAGWCVTALLRRDWKAAGLGAASAIPAMSWWLYVQANTGPDGTRWLASYPFSGIIERTIQGIDSPMSSSWLRMAAVFEEVALAGIWLSLILAFYLLWKRRAGLVEVTAVCFALFAGALGKLDIWSSAYATGRTMSPLLILLGLIALRERRVVFALPMFLVLPRIALQYEAQIKAML